MFKYFLKYEFFGENMGTNETHKRMTFVIDRKTANTFIVKCREEQTTASAKLRKWIEKYLNGDLNA